MSGKHAYLIMAHNEFDILEKLLNLLDDTINDFYVHIDKKAKNVDLCRLEQAVRHSSLYYIKRTDNRWGHYSLVQCELNLLKAALKGNYRYYHLLSGVDLPLKTNDEIHDFFDRHNGCEFIHYHAEEADEFIQGRVKHYHAMKYFQTGNKYVSFLGRNLDFLLENLQGRFGFEKKWDETVTLQSGSQWFSITHDMAAYFISKEPWIKRYFRFASVPDEMVLQTVAFNSPFKDNLYQKERNGSYFASVRCIDWQRGDPYTFRKEDFEELIHSECLFARKFSTKIDREIIEKIFSYLSDKANGKDNHA